MNVSARHEQRTPTPKQAGMSSHPTILEALDLAETLDGDHHDWQTVRALKLKLRSLAKDAEDQP